MEPLTPALMTLTKRLSLNLKGSSKRAELINANRQRLESTYGSLADWQLWDILQAEKERAKCEGCKGLPCQKGSTTIPAINCDAGDVWISYSICPFEQANRRQRSLAKKISAAKIPERYLGKSLADYSIDAYNARAVKYAKTAKTSGRGAFFYGDCGTGKTFLAATIAQDFLQDNKSVLFVKVPSLLNEFYSIIRQDSDLSERELMKDLSTVDLLILDDLGMEKSTLYVGSQLCKIIDARYDAQKQTIITSNNTLDGIQANLNNATDGKSHNGSRIVDRIKDFCDIIQLKGFSRRNSS